MIIEHQLAVGLPIEETFARLRCFPQAYPHFHPAHRPHPPGSQAPVLMPDTSFRVSEHLGLEERRYAFQVSRFEFPTRLFMRAEVLTRVAGLFMMKSGLTLEFRLLAVPGGTQIQATQRVRWPGGKWQGKLLELLFGGQVRRHADEETAQGIAVMVDLEPPPEALVPPEALPPSA